MLTYGFVDELLGEAARVGRAELARSHLHRLPESLRDPFLDAVVAELGPDAGHDHVRLNLLATAR